MPHFDNIITERARQRRRRPPASSSSRRLGMAVMALTTVTLGGRTCRGGHDGSRCSSTVGVSAFQITSSTCQRRQRTAAAALVARSNALPPQLQQRRFVRPSSALLATVERKDGGDGPSQQPLFDVDLAADSSSSSRSTFQVSESQPPALFEDDSRPGPGDGDDDEGASEPYDGAQFYDLNGEWDGQDQAEEEWRNGNGVGGAVPATAEAAWDEYARDEDDILTEREDRLYVDEDGISRKVERCILVGVEDLSEKRRVAKEARKAGREVGSPESEQVYFTLEESMTEMRELIKTAGMELVGEVTQRLSEPNPKMYVGTGKAIEAEEALKEHGACTVVFDAELSPGQQKALENAFNKQLLQNDFLGAEQGEIKVVDRTALILDIFAQHAKTREGKLQVDLALHEYRKPRLTRMWTHLERQSGAGGVGLRGPGESQLEIDKRLLRDRIIVLKKKIDDVQKQRDLHRRGRSNAGLPILALVGYTNAGKSTLLNYLTRAGVMAENILFATLDPTTRKVKLPGYKTHPEVLLTDTVGFIQKLPTQLVAAFRATLEEVREADVLIHVVDVSNPMWPKQANAVRSVLSEIGAGDRPMVQLLNKIDLLSAEDAEYCRAEARGMKNAVAVSSLTGEGMEDFVAVTEEALSDLLVPVEMELPYSKGDELNTIHEVGAVETIEYRETGTYVKGRVPRAIANRLQEYSLVETGHAMSTKKKQKKGHEDEVDWAAVGRGRHSAKNV